MTTFIKKFVEVISYLDILHGLAKCFQMILFKTFEPP